MSSMSRQLNDERNARFDTRLSVIILVIGAIFVFVSFVFIGWFL